MGLLGRVTLIPKKLNTRGEAVYIGFSYPYGMVVRKNEASKETSAAISDTHRIIKRCKKTMGIGRASVYRALGS